MIYSQSCGVCSQECTPPKIANTEELPCPGLWPFLKQPVSTYWLMGNKGLLSPWHNTRQFEVFLKASQIQRPPWDGWVLHCSHITAQHFLLPNPGSLTHYRCCFRKQFPISLCRLISISLCFSTKLLLIPLCTQCHHHHCSSSSSSYYYKMLIMKVWYLFVV